MNRTLKRVLIGLGAFVGLALVGGGGYAFALTRAFDASMEQVYEIPLTEFSLSEDAEVLARGKHLSESLGGCAIGDCHGTDLAGGKPLAIGPVGEIAGPNITPGGMLAAYSNAELARLIKTGVKKDGRSVLMMPVQDFSWLPDSDVVALVSYLRTVPAVDKPNEGVTRAGPLGKVLDRREAFPWDIARKVASVPKEVPPAPEPTAAYGRFVVRLCTNCHGETLAGGPLPGAPPSIPVPLNVTPHESGLAGWSYDDFVKLMRQGVRKNGEKLNPFMPLEAVSKLDDTEMQALWAYLVSVPPKPFGER
jgi:hypothetical protein